MSSFTPSCLERTVPRDGPAAQRKAPDNFAAELPSREWSTPDGQFSSTEGYHDPKRLAQESGSGPRVSLGHA